MAELEARYEDPRQGSRLLWRQTLPDDRDVSVGRNPLTLADAPPENRAEWVTDPQDIWVSGCHAFVRWDGLELHVRIRSHPAKPTNAIYFRGRPADAFRVPPGETFTIGRTTFRLHTGVTADGGDTDDPLPTGVQPPAQYRLGAEALQRLVFHDPAHALKVLAGFPKLIRYSREDATRDDHVLKLLVESLPQADVAAIVVTDDQPGQDGRVAVRRVAERGVARQVIEFRPSARLTREALFGLANRLHVRGQRFDSQVTDVTLGAGVDWAICTPLVQEAGRRVGLYVAGHLTLPGGVDLGLGKPPPELEDYQKVIELAAQIYASAHHLRQAEQKATRYRSFLSHSLVTVLDAAGAEDRLRPGETTVTVLFCDLRGSCKLAEQGAEDLLANWQRISQALDLMTTAIIDEQGVIGNLQGDAAMGFWGWPLEQPDQVQRAARAALRIQRDFHRGKAGGPRACGIGVAHGRAVAGRLGTFDQIKLDVFGPVVNLAARLEGLTKAEHFGVPILVDGPVADALRSADPVRAQFQTRRLGKVRPAGMGEAAEVFELVPAGKYTDEQVAHWEAAVREFGLGKWTHARQQLEQFALVSGEVEPTDRPAVWMLSQMADQKGRAPADWDGVMRVEQK